MGAAGVTELADENEFFQIEDGVREVGPGGGGGSRFFGRRGRILRGGPLNETLGPFDFCGGESRAKRVYSYNGSSSVAIIDWLAEV